jgi:phosphoserine phosphatase RsbX
MKQGVIDWACASRPLPGEVESGDLHIVAPFAGGALIGVIDGLGHGPEAAIASRRAHDTLESAPAEQPVLLAERCHESLRGTRGAALSVISLSSATGHYAWVGVGNVEAVRFRGSAGAPPGREALISAAGVVGYQIPRLRARQAELEPGDLFVLASDGISPRFVEHDLRGSQPEEIASDILTRYARASDDALVLVVRYLGAET